MMIPDNLLIEHGARVVSLAKNELLFHQGSKAYYYFQVKLGEVKMVHYNEQGQEFIQN